MAFCIERIRLSTRIFVNEATQKLFKHEMYLNNGMVYVSDKPGLGIEFDESLAQEYPYKRSYLPVSRLEDGTLWHW